MTIRVHPQAAAPIDPNYLTALITRSILTPTSDDAPDARTAKLGAGWVRWSEGQLPRLAGSN